MLHRIIRLFAPWVPPFRLAKTYPVKVATVMELPKLERCNLPRLVIVKSLYAGEVDASVAETYRAAWLPGQGRGNDRIVPLFYATRRTRKPLA